MYTATDIAVREIGSGIWFWSSMCLALGFSGYIVRKLILERDSDPVLLGVAFFMLLFFIGSAMRAFMSWMQFFYLGNGWDAAYWTMTWPWYGMSVLLNIVGATGTVWLLTTWKWRILFTLFTVVGAILVPSLLRIYQ